RRVEAGADVDLPELIHGGVVIGGKRAVGEAGEHQSAAGAERTAVIRIGDVHGLLDLADERIGDREVGLVALCLLVGAALPVAGLVAQIGIAREQRAIRQRRDIDRLGFLAVGRGPEIVAAGGIGAHLLGWVLRRRRGRAAIELHVGIGDI